MNQHTEAKSDLLAWIEGTLESSRRSVVTLHLEECADCRRYFEMLSASLEPSASRTEPVLVADPYLPLRVKALAADRGAREGSLEGAALRWTWRTAAFVLAMLLGIFIGESLSYRPQEITDHLIVYEYSNVFWDSGIESRWHTISQVGGEAKR